ncbi:MAG: SsrA-binding protein, partial [Myxococcota bacterium]|nr:SsrA-binding protein [Myxococcota bacterium]
MDIQIAATNRKAYHEYHILDKYEAGIELVGSEVKSLREGSANLKE